MQKKVLSTVRESAILSKVGCYNTVSELEMVKALGVQARWCRAPRTRRLTQMVQLCLGNPGKGGVGAVVRDSKGAVLGSVAAGLSSLPSGERLTSVLIVYLRKVSSLMQNADIDANTAAKLVVEYEIYSLLLDCLVNGNEQVATASTEAIRSLALSSKGMAIIFPANGNGATHLSNLAARCSSLGRIRIFALIVKLCADSGPVSSTIYNSNLLSLLEAEIVDTSDMLMTFSVLELLYELSEIPHGAKFLSKSTFLQLLTSMISNTTVESLLRSRAIMISGKLLSSESIRTDVDESSINAVFSAIDGRFKLLKDQDSDEFESMLEALGQIGSYVQGAELLLSSPAPLARHVVDAAFDRQGRGKQLFV
ncbi:hypothetical protein GIB67_039209 [Kingdonia uniflora]|uniref:Uncharacterized protein n=1 Tax=Kingdonia uniflora TaxID=39325 RepID=A0A7J7MME6_9MAGN|nr:hypothetical protein GIB67_039209 [Kingdonia uniflora]